MSTSTRRRLILVGLVTVALSASSTPALAQGQGGFPQQVLEALAALQASVDTLTDAQTANVQFTPVVNFESGLADCLALNVVNEDRHIKIDLINAITGIAVASVAGSIATGPGRSRGVGAAASAFTGSLYCRFEVLDGVGADIRGNVNIQPGDGFNTTLSLASR
jgi:hypothetical protein